MPIVVGFDIHVNCRLIYPCQVKICRHFLVEIYVNQPFVCDLYNLCCAYHILYFCVDFLLVVSFNVLHIFLNYAYIK